MRNIPEDLKSSENTKRTHNEETVSHDDSIFSLGLLTQMIKAL
jgi:hypothetical protein